MTGGCVIYEFGEFRLDVAQRLLQLKAGGRPLPLTAKAFETLLYFLEHPGELLEKSRLMKALWPDMVVEDNNLNQNVSLLRRVLGECPGEHRFIVTVPGRGYRFVAEVRSLNDAGRRAAVSTEPRTEVYSRTAIAVLPFVNLTDDPATEHLGDSLAEELINTLVRVRWFRVPARTSSFAYRGMNLDVRQIARELDVGAVLEGSIRATGEGFRFTAQLIDGQHGHHIWSESYDRGREALSQIQDELTVAIVDALAGHFVLGTTARKVPTRDLAAFHLYLAAMSLRGQPTEHNLGAAIDLLARATVRDPEFARAWYAVAEARAFGATSGICSEELLEDAERDATRALALDPCLSSAHGVLGVLRAGRACWIEAEAEFSRARALVARNPETLVCHAAYVSRQVGHRRRALQETQAAYELAPASPALTFQVGLQRLLHGDDARAVRWINAAIANGYPTTLRAVSEGRALLAMREKRFSDAAEVLVETLSPASRAAGGFEAILAFYGALSEPASAAAAVTRLQDWLHKLGTRDLDRVTAQRSMIWFTLLGALDVAHALAERTLERWAASGILGCGWGILWITEMHEFRSHMRFQEVVSRLRLREYWDQYGPPDGYALREGALVAAPESGSIG
jgi:TolB-like protein